VLSAEKSEKSATGGLVTSTISILAQYGLWLCFDIVRIASMPELVKGENVTVPEPPESVVSPTRTPS